MCRNGAEMVLTIFCTVTGPDPRFFKTPRGEEQRWVSHCGTGGYFFGKRGERKLERECRFVNGTLVVSGLENLFSVCRQFTKPDEMRNPVSDGMLYAPKFSTRFEAQEIKGTGNEED